MGNFTGAMEDRLAIRELCDTYCDAVMCKDMAMWGETWAEDAEWVHPTNTVKGRAAIMAASQKVMDTFSTGIFFSQIGRTQVTGTRATGRCYHVEFFIFPDAPGLFLTHYDDVYAKIDGRWYFQRRTLSVSTRAKLPNFPA